MKNSILFLALVILTILLSIFLPWWIIGPLSLMAIYISGSKPIVAFFIPFAAVFLAWLLSIYFSEADTVSSLMGKLFELDAFLIPIIASLLGGIVAGLFGLTASLLLPAKQR